MDFFGIQYNIRKADRTDRKVQNLASYINVNTLRAIHRTMDKKKAYGIDYELLIKSITMYVL